MLPVCNRLLIQRDYASNISYYFYKVGISLLECQFDTWAEFSTFSEKCHILDFYKRTTVITWKKWRYKDASYVYFFIIEKKMVKILF